LIDFLLIFAIKTIP